MAEPPSSPPGSRSAAPQTPPPGAGDPSMEDILASIRRILNEDEPAADPDRPAQGPEDEPLDLTREMLVAGPPAAAPPAAPAPAPPPAASAQRPPPAETPSPQAPPNAPAPPAAAPLHDSPPPPASGALLAPAVAAAASASVGDLLRAVAAERGSAVRGGGPTIEDVVREELRPMLKDWLDQHLPAVVERLVRAEIERVVGRALS